MKLSGVSIFWQYAKNLYVQSRKDSRSSIRIYRPDKERSNENDLMVRKGEKRIPALFLSR